VSKRQTVNLPYKSNHNICLLENGGKQAATMSTLFFTVNISTNIQTPVILLE